MKTSCMPALVHLLYPSMKARHRVSNANEGELELDASEPEGCVLRGQPSYSLNKCMSWHQQRRNFAMTVKIRPTYRKPSAEFPGEHNTNPTSVDPEKRGQGPFGNVSG